MRLNGATPSRVRQSVIALRRPVRNFARAPAVGSRSACNDYGPARIPPPQRAWLGVAHAPPRLI